jgi:hypothetical protein
VVIRYNEKYEKVRLLCVHTPEFVHPDKKQNIPMGNLPESSLHILWSYDEHCPSEKAFLWLFTVIAIRKCTLRKLWI